MYGINKQILVSEMLIEDHCCSLYC